MESIMGFEHLHLSPKGLVVVSTSLELLQTTSASEYVASSTEEDQSFEDCDNQ